MPKASSSSSAPYSISSGSQPNVLKRNQACHQCRRRKLKCDAKRPCSTCIRSHTHAVTHAPPGSLPPALECTFDETADCQVPAPEGPRNRYERLENRIHELEALLHQRQGEASTSSHVPVIDALSLSPGHIMPSLSAKHSSMRDHTPSPSNYSHGVIQSTVSEFGRIIEEIPRQGYGSSSVSPLSSGPRSATARSPPHAQDILWSSWPPNIPPPELLRHLVEVFFVFHPHAGRLFHSSTFMASLSLPATHPKFPAAPVLHAICAIGSLYTAVVSSPPLPDFAKVKPDEIFTERYRISENRPDSFAEQQATLAKETADRLEFMGEALLQIVQARVILSWFYWSHSRWVEVFTSAAHSLRVSLPLGLNVCPPFHSITKSQRPPSILPVARTVIEDETRRNVFWLAYATERSHGLGNGWALCMDDQDVSQLLPVRGDCFEKGILVTPHERQWAHSRDLLLSHPESQTDSFILYIKGTILMSRVKVFNHRFRARHFSGDASVASSQNLRGDNSLATVDPRGSPAFIELDHLVSSFRASFPKDLRNPIRANVVDNHLYTACLMPQVATIVLHDPHADIQKAGCTSALKILTAARDILDLIYAVWSTSFDITLLDSFCTFCWYSAGRVLARFMRAAIDVNIESDIATLGAEVQFIQAAILKFGERVPLAYRFAKMLEDFVGQICKQPTFPSQLSSELLTSAPMQQSGGISDVFYDPGLGPLEALLETQHGLLR